MEEDRDVCPSESRNMEGAVTGPAPRCYKKGDGAAEHRKPDTCFPGHPENCPVLSLLQGLYSWKVPQVEAFGYSEGSMRELYSFLDEGTWQ